MGNFYMSLLSNSTIQSVIKSTKIKKILIGQITNSIKRVWVIPIDGNSPSVIMNDIENQLKKSFPNYIIKKEGPNQKNIDISGTRNGRIVVSSNGRTNFTHIYVRDPASKPKVEDIQVKKINDLIWDLYKSSGPITFKIGNKTYKISNYNENTIRQIGKKGDKTDVVISTDTGNVYISLKGSSYQQWGGASDFANDPSVKKFVNELKKIKAQNPSDRSEYHMDISDDLIKKSVYGRDFNITNSGSENNVDHVLVGSTISMSGTGNEITAIKTYDRGEIPDPRPKLISRNTGPGDKNRSDFGIPNTRILIWPGSRVSSKEIT